MPVPAPRTRGKRSSMGSIPWHSQRPRPAKHSKPDTSTANHKLGKAGKPHTPDRPDRPGRHGRPGRPHRLRPNRPHPTPHPYSHRPHHRPSSAPSSRPSKPPALTRPHPDRPSRPISEGPTVSSSRPTTSSSHSRPSKHHSTSRPPSGPGPNYSHSNFNPHSPHSHGHYHAHSSKPGSSRPPSSHRPTTKPYHHEDSSTQASDTPSTTSYLPTSNPTSRTSSRPRGYPKPLPRGNGFPVIAHGNFLSNRPASFTFEPVPKPSSYSIRTRGTNRFRVVPKPASLHATKTLVDNLTGTPVPLVRIHHHMFSARGAVTISAVGGGSLMVLQRSSVVRVGQRVLHGYIKGRSGKPDLVIRVSDGGREFIMRDRRSNEVARIYRNRASKKGERPKRHAYKIVVHPGYDTLLFVMCVVCLHEMWDDNRR